jgi:rhodanese-related sulfurtransferase
MRVAIFYTLTAAAALTLGNPLRADEPSPTPEVETPAVETEEPQPTSDSLETVKNNLELKKAILVDVREQAEWDEGRLQRARLVPLSKIQEGLKPEALPKDKIIYLHCRSGGRSLIAQELLKKEGYDVRSLEQGYQDLLDAGFKQAE